MLDFSIYSDKERTEYIEKELEKKEKYTSKELEAMANYILFGKDSNGKNAVDRGEIEIDTRYQTFKKKNVNSLDELMENVSFNERDLKPLKRSIYNNPKPVLDKEDPELMPLLEEIKKWQYVYDVATGLKEDPSIAPKTPTEIYKIKHFLIELKKQQYTILDAHSYPIKVLGDKTYILPASQLDKNIVVAPLGLKMGDMERFLNPKEDKNSKFQIPEKFDINFENSEHVYLILEHYFDLLEETLNSPEKNGKYLLETLDFYIDFANFEESRKIIIDCKKQKISNLEIKRKLEDKYGLNYNENYISTIYTKEICKKIAEAATLHKDYWLERKNPSKWKKCKECGQWKLKDNREFVKKKSSLDGFATRCKLCDKKKRQKEKNK